MPPCFSNHVRSMRCSTSALGSRFDRSWPDWRIFVDRTFFSLSDRICRLLRRSLVRPLPMSGWVVAEHSIPPIDLARTSRFSGTYANLMNEPKIFSSPSSSSIIRDSYFPEDSLGTHYIVLNTATTRFILRSLRIIENTLSQSPAPRQNSSSVAVRYLIPVRFSQDFRNNFSARSKAV